MAQLLANRVPAVSDQLASVELFAGAGGLALGLHRAGFQPAAVVEHDEDCAATLKANGRDGRAYTRGWNVLSESVTDVDYSNVGPVQLLSAGAPCQPFSIGGQGKGDWDDRNMFPEVVRAIHDLEPRAFLIENVRGLLFPRMVLYWKRLLRELRTPKRSYGLKGQAGPGRPRDEYKVFFKVLNAADFGLPQNRLRLFIVGLPLELAHLWRWPEPTHSRDALIQALLDDEYWELHGASKRVRKAVREQFTSHTRKRLKPYGERWQTLRDLLSEIDPPADSAMRSKDASHVLVPGARLYVGHTGSKLDWPAKTVKAGVHGCPGGEHIALLDNGKHRYLTVRECALLQGFPPDYMLPELRIKAMRQIGNAVPVNVATAMGVQLAEVLRSG